MFMRVNMGSGALDAMAAVGFDEEPVAGAERALGWSCDRATSPDGGY
jgi:hypothetical protein